MSDDPNEPESHIDLVVEDPEWELAAPEAPEVARRAAAMALRGLLSEQQRGAMAEVSLVLADDARVQELNLNYRGHNKPTNVLSFPLQTAEAFSSRETQQDSIPVEQPRLLGDVILARQTVCREAKEQGKPLEHHLSHLVVHGILHLLGYDHENDRDAEDMEAREVSILSALGIPDPYWHNA